MFKQKKGFEPSTFAMAKQYSTTELFLQNKVKLYLLRELNPCFCLEKATSLPLDEKDFYNFSSEIVKKTKTKGRKKNTIVKKKGLIPGFLVARLLFFL